MFRLVLSLTVMLMIGHQAQAAVKWNNSNTTVDGIEVSSSVPLNAKCEYTSDLFGKSIGIVGDSLFATDKNGAGSLANMIGLHFHASKVQNAAVGGATVLGLGNNSVQNQRLDGTLDLLILGGGGNDFSKCGTDKKCLSGKIDKFVSPDLESGAFPKIIEKYKSENTIAVILYTSIVANHAPKKWKAMVKSGLAASYAERMSSLANSENNVLWLDAATVLKPDIKSHWLNDGFHPSSLGYKLLSEQLFQKICEQ
jgi:lysophospholipase L1-like esterase